MRIISDKPMELLRGLVTEHLPRVVPLDGVQWLLDDSHPMPDPSRYATLPAELCSIDDPEVVKVKAAEMATKIAPVDLKAFNTRIVLCGPAPGEETAEVRFDVVAGIGPESPTPFLLLTSDGTILHAAHTNMAIHPDGMVQIGGYEPRVSLMTHAEIRAERGKRLLVGGTWVSSFAVEHRTNGGAWSSVEISFNPTAIELREIRED